MWRIEFTFSLAILPLDVVDEELEVDVVDEDVVEEDELVIPFARVPVTSTLWPT